VSQIFSDQNIDAVDTSYGQHRPAGFRIYDATSPSDSYRGQNQLIAPFLSAELPLLKKFKILAGVRMEDNTQYLQTAVGADSISLKTNTRFYLPSFNLKYDFTRKSLLRFVYGETLNRPEFRESTPFLYYDFELMALSHGSLFPSIDHPAGLKLKTATIKNYDLRYELYPGLTEMITVGVFYKKFKNPIEQIAEAHEHRTGVSRETTFRNSDAAYCYGVEIEVRKNLLALDNILGTKVFQNLNLIANTSLIKSQVYNSNDSLLKTRPLQGQAPYLANVGLFYGNKSNPKGLQFSITYNIIGPRIFLAGGTDGPHTESGPSIGEMQRHLLDLTVRKSITKHISINFGIQDLLNQPVTFVEDSNQDGKFNIKQGDKVIIKYRKGSYYTFGIKIQL
jgi:outer membrane receptor protein involved in Fe transport